jgi:hypothetical protein
LADKFFRRTDKHGGSCIFILNELKFIKLTIAKTLGKEKVFEMSAIELFDIKIIVVCVYRSPNCNIDDFLELLEQTVNKNLKRDTFWFYVVIGILI